MSKITKDVSNNLITLIIFSLILLDQLTKRIIVLTMDEGDSIEIIKDFFYISSHRNTGASFGIMSGAMNTFILITLVAFVLFYFLIKDVDIINKKIYSIGIIIMIAGAVGNFIDRVLFQEVVDFLDFVIFGYDFAIFNVADILLVIGVILFTIDIIFLDAKRPKNSSKWRI